MMYQSRYLPLTRKPLTLLLSFVRTALLQGAVRPAEPPVPVPEVEEAEAEALEDRRHREGEEGDGQPGLVVV